MSVALHDGRHDWTAHAISEAQQAATEWLISAGTRVLATWLDNGPAFVVLDEACAEADVIHVPIPAFFTPAQAIHALQSAGADTLIAIESVATTLTMQSWKNLKVAGKTLYVSTWVAQTPLPPKGTSKITYTSGSTGTPKGVCLRQATLHRVVDSIAHALGPLNISRHLSTLSFAVLLENIAGQMVARRQGATLITPALSELGWTGSSQFDPAVFHSAVLRYAPESMILLPQMLRAWCEHLQQSKAAAPRSLKFVAVGGASVGSALLSSAHALGIPAYEGYGLSEGASVQTLNLPSASRPGSVGRPLPHARLRVNAEGEIEIAGSLMAGYLGESEGPAEWWPSGDLGEIDEEGYVHIRGRKKNVLITAYGRNISPEWVETTLGQQKVIGHAVVFGDGEPRLWAVVWPLRNDTPDIEIQKAVDISNASLPDYAHVTHWIRGRKPFNRESGFATGNGRPQRAHILAAHSPLMNTHPFASLPATS